MRKISSLLAMAVAISGLAASANANFIVTATRTENVVLQAPAAGTGLVGGAPGQIVDVITFKVQNDGLNGTGTKLFGIDLTATATGPMVFQSVDSVGDGPINSVNTLANPNIAPFGSSAGSYIRYGSASGFSAIYNAVTPALGTSPENRQDPGQTGSTTGDTKPNYQNALTFHVVGGVLGGVAANGAGGINVASIVVPHGAFITLAGTYGGDNGPNFVSVTDPVPEPASLGVLALGGLALIARRRKA